MTTSLLAPKAVLCWCLAAAIPAAVLAQSSLPSPCSPSGAEYAPAGSRPGNQVHAATALGASGGYVVCEDDTIVKSGSGIRAFCLDANLSPVPASGFRVNKTTGASQAHPQAVLLAGGGAAFVWQSGRPGFQHLLARFLSPTNTWLTEDVTVNTFNQHFQVDPAIAALSNGNVIIVWSSFNQAGYNSMQDVYGQLFSPSGQKIGGEFLVNQFTDFNQRTPAVAALAGGGFVVGWVSEQQQQRTFALPSEGVTNVVNALPRPSADVYARLFTADGLAVGNEFPVNTGTDVCANPRLAPGSDGGFMVVWGQKCQNVPVYSWDVFARGFSGDGTGGAVQTVNTQLIGDQYAPQVSALGTNYLVVWTSLGQKGARVGVYGQYLAGNGTPEGAEFRVNTTVPKSGSQMNPAVGSDGDGRFLVVWSSFAGVAAGVDLFAQRYAVPGFVPSVATVVYSAPLDPAYGNPWGIGGANLGPGAGLLAYPVDKAFSAGGSNGFAAAAGPYRGLFSDTNNPALGNWGYFTALVTARGTNGFYTAKVMLGKGAYAISGKFNSAGWATNLIRRGASLGSLAVQLQLDLAGGNQLRGTLSSDTWSASLVADRQTFNKSTAPWAAAGRYTVLVPADEYSVNSPAGVGYGVAVVDKAGNVLFAAALADGTKISQASAVSSQGVWPLYCPAYGSGSVIAWMQFDTNQPDSDLSGQMIWTKPAGVPGKYYPAGFVNEITAIGSAYVAPAAGQRILDLNHGDGSLVFYSGGLTQPFTNSFNLDLRNRATSAAPADKLSLGFTAPLGLFRGSTLNRQTGKATAFQGAVFQKGNTGAGFFLVPYQAGGFYLSPAP